MKSEDEMWLIAKELMLELAACGAMFFVGAVDVATYPPEQALRDGRIVKLLPEHHYPMAFQAAVGAMSQQGLVAPDTQVRLWADTQKSKIDYWDGLDAVQVGQFFQHNHITREQIASEKPLLLDAADILAYTAGRALSREQSRNKDRCLELYNLCRPFRGDAEWNPPPSVPVPGEDVFIRSIGPYCEWGWVDDPLNGPEPFIAAKVSPGSVSLVPRNPRIEVRGPAVAVRVGSTEVGIVLFLFRIEGLSSTFLAPVNHCAASSVNPLLFAVKTGTMRVCLYEDKPEPSRCLKWTDMDVSSFAVVLDKIASLPPWRNEDFMAALASVEESPDQLWDLGEPSSRT